MRYEFIETWSPKDPVGGYHEVDWRDLSSAPGGQHFIRVTGTADSSESAAVIKAISSLRQQSEAFVITNAVKVDGVQDVDTIAESIEDIKSVSVLDLLLDMLDEKQQAVIHQLLKEEQQ